MDILKVAFSIKSVYDNTIRKQRPHKKSPSRFNPCCNSLSPKKQCTKTAKELEYRETTRKFTVYQLLIKYQAILIGETAPSRPNQRHRVVVFQDGNGHDIRVVTDLMTVSAEQVADMYKNRWQIGLSFRWIKQHSNVPTRFGTTQNAIYGQLYFALIVYVLLQFFYNTGS